jgi:hypothetical protein
VYSLISLIKPAGKEAVIRFKIGVVTFHSLNVFDRVCLSICCPPIKTALLDAEILQDEFEDNNLTGAYTLDLLPGAYYHTGAQNTTAAATLVHICPSGYTAGGNLKAAHMRSRRRFIAA